MTLDNASNNNTFFDMLEEELEMRSIPINKSERHIRSVSMSTGVLVASCFPHIVILACKAVLSAFTNLHYAKHDATDYVPAQASST